MANGKQAGLSADRAGGLDGLREGDMVIVLQLPGVLLPPEAGLALLRSASPGGAVPPPPRSKAPAGNGLRHAGRAMPMHMCHGVDAPETYIYLPASKLQADPDAGLNEEASRLQRADPESGLKGAVSRLQDAACSFCPAATATACDVTQIIDGASSGAAPTFHYVVETDVLLGAENDFNAWYKEEHLPGLAAVPGTVRAMRLRNAEGSPRYHALYLLKNRETFGSEPWLKVRATDWSSRVRPNFINTKRTMFRIQRG